MGLEAKLAKNLVQLSPSETASFLPTIYCVQMDIVQSEFLGLF